MRGRKREPGFRDAVNTSLYARNPAVQAGYALQPGFRFLDANGKGEEM